MFKGPVFIVGRPRSGTKLLRSLLSQHYKISIPFWESSFIPHLADSFPRFGDLSQPRNFSDFFRFYSRIEFFEMIRKQSQYAQIVCDQTWFNAIEEYSYAGVISAFFKLYAKCDAKTIWGDKSPHYMLHTKLLKELFPEARFVHIIRDVRDHCLSNMKAWNKNPYRAAQMWVDAIRKCRSDAELYLKDDYFEIKYETLIENPKAELMNICNFLDVEYENTMSNLQSPAENLGDAKGKTTILSGNKGKWRRSMGSDMVARIEMISFGLLKELGYPVCYARCEKSIKSYQMKLFKAVDAWNRFVFDCSFQGGLFNAIAYQYRKRRYF